MPKFLSQAMADLTRQLTYAPLKRVRQQMQSAEELYRQVDPALNYPLEFVVFRVTRTRPPSPAEVTLTGEALRHDLLVMVEVLSRAVGDKAEDYDPRPLDLPTLCRRLNVTAKTVSRYRRAGLFGRGLIWPDGRVRIGFLPASVERFIGTEPAKVAKAAKFDRMDEQTRHEIIMRARRIVARAQASPFQVARHLSRRFGRSTETLRLFLLRHDRADPRVAVFPKHRPPLDDKHRKIVFRAYQRGVPVGRMAQRYGRSRNAIYRCINLMRAERLTAAPLRFVHNPTFELPDARRVILDNELAPPPGKNPSPDARTEVSLFVRYNFLKFLAAGAVRKLNPSTPPSGRLDEAETLLRRAAAVRQTLVECYLRVVTATAKKHMAGSRDSPSVNMADLVGEGNLVLLETLETFDPAQGNRFSTYLTWSLMRRYARHVPTSGRNSGNVERADPRAPDPAPASEQAEHVSKLMPRLLGILSERERITLTRRYGLSESDGRSGVPRSVAEVAAELKVSPQRVRQIEHRAMVKVRKHARRMELNP